MSTRCMYPYMKKMLSSFPPKINVGAFVNVRHVWQGNFSCNQHCVGGRWEEGYQSISKSANDREFQLIVSTVLSRFPLLVHDNCIE